MSVDVLDSPAKQAADATLAQLFDCIDNKKSFRLEAGAGSGKTYSLVQALKHILTSQERTLSRNNQRVACITYTNVARDEIESRIDNHPLVFPATIHAFCWSLIRDFQPALRENLFSVGRWPEKQDEAGDIGEKRIEYDQGYSQIEELRLLLSHDDVLELTVKLLSYPKFVKILSARFPILFIDEYQDTSLLIAETITQSLLDSDDAPQIGFFGDHWQTIYDDGCGALEHPRLKVLSLNANFRSAAAIVTALNQMRPELPQEVHDTEMEGRVLVYHTNNWHGDRQTGQHWGGDLPGEVAQQFFASTKGSLIDQGWSFDPDNTKILMLTQKVLSREQGYQRLLGAFKYSDSLIKQSDAHVDFCVNFVEPVVAAFTSERYGEMAKLLKDAWRVGSRKDKAAFSTSMARLVELRETATIGEVVDFIRESRLMSIPERVLRHEAELANIENIEEPKRTIVELQKLRLIPYQEMIAATEFIKGFTPFSTKHGVKGAEYDNVFAVFGRGWNKYNWEQFLEWGLTGPPADKVETFKRNRNLFYVVCSRPKQRLALLFTQRLSPRALDTLENWFGAEAIHGLS